nr:hypothetical protein GCM10020093_081110 [Planobispora longispora]
MDVGTGPLDARQDLADDRGGQTGRQEGPDVPDDGDGVLRIAAVPAAAALGPQQPLLLVVTQQARVRPALPGQLPIFM